MRIVSITPAKDGKKKYIATFSDGTSTKFGAFGSNDFTITGDEERKRLYRLRHAKDLDTKDPKRAGFLSYYLLWNKPTLSASLKDYNKIFG